MKIKETARWCLARWHIPSDDISNLWQISIRNISSLFRKERTRKEIAREKQTVYELRKASCKAKECCNCLRCTQIDCQIGVCSKHTKREKKQTLSRRNQQVFLMLFWSIYLRLSTVRYFMAIRYLFNFIHNSSVYNVRETNKVEMKKRSFAKLKNNWFCFSLLNDDSMLIQFIKR